MPTAVIAAIAEYVGTTVAVVETAITVVEVIAVIGSTVYSQDQQRRAQNEAKDAYNASLRDRYVMFRAATEARQLVLGRARVSGPMFFCQSYGANKEHLVFCVALAAHEIDGIEDIYFNDLPVIIDVNGNVYGTKLKDSFTTTSSNGVVTITTAPGVGTVTGNVIYGTTIIPLTITSVTGVDVSYSGATPGQAGIIEISYQPAVSPFVNGTAQTKSDLFGTPSGSTVTLTSTPTPGTLIGSYIVTPGNGGDGSPDIYGPFTPVLSSGTTYSGFPAGASGVTVTYQVAISVSKCRIRKYLGAPGQTADAGMITAFPGVWTANHTATGIAYLVVEMDYDPTAFPGGIPNISALVRGAKVTDPRTNVTAWTDNPALLAYYYATSPLGGRLTPDLLDVPSFIVGANDCDTAVTYNVNGHAYNRKLYTGGMTAKANVKPADILNELIQTGTAGKWAFVNSQLRIKIGVYKPPVLTIDETWLTNSQQIQIQPAPARSNLVNSVVATFADAGQDYKVVQMPRVQPATYVSEDGQILPLNLTMQSVQFTGQAQHIAACQLRDARANAVVSIGANMRAYQLQIFDTVNLNLARFGWTPKTFEVIDASWSIKGITLNLKATDSTILQLGAAFVAFDPTKSTRLPSPWVVGNVLNLTTASGTAQLLRQADGTIVSRILVSWTKIADAAVYSEGKIEVRYGLAGTDFSTWTSIEAQGSDTNIYISNVKDGAAYVVTARAKNLLVSGQWSLGVLCIVIGKTARPVDVSSLAWAASATGGTVTWATDTEVDYDHTQLRVGSSWSTGAELFKGATSSYTWLAPPVGTYTVFAKNFDTSGNESLNAAAVSITVTASQAIQWANIVGRPQLFRVVTRGQYDTYGPILAGLYVGDSATGISVSASGGTRSYTVHVIRRSDAVVLSSTVYDVFIDPANANALATQLNGLGNDVVVVVRGEHEPQSNRKTSAMLLAMLRCGASQAIFGSPQFKYRSAFVLVGIPGSGEGNGYEAYSGSIDNDTNAWCDVAFTLLSGNLLITGSGATPRTLADYSYTGSLDATTDVSLIARGNCVVTGNTGSKVGGSAAWDSDIYSVDSFTGGSYASAIPAQNNASFMFGLNSDPTTDASYTSLDYAWACRTDGFMDIWESNVGVSLNIPYVANDVLAIVYDGFKVTYLQNGVIKRSVAAPASLKLFWDSSFNNPGAVLRNIRFGPLSSVANIDTPQLISNAATDVIDSSSGSGSIGTGPAHVVTNEIDIISSVNYTNSTARAVNVQLTIGISDAGLTYNGTFSNITAKLFYDVSLNGAAPTRTDFQTSWVDRSISGFTLSPTVTINILLAAGSSIAIRLGVELINTDSVRLFWGKRYMTGSAIKA